jgi:hypothetical protein
VGLLKLRSDGFASRGRIAPLNVLPKRDSLPYDPCYPTDKGVEAPVTKSGIEDPPYAIGHTRVAASSPQREQHTAPPRRRHARGVLLFNSGGASARMRTRCTRLLGNMVYEATTQASVTRTAREDSARAPWAVDVPLGKVGRRFELPDRRTLVRALLAKGIRSRR